MARTGKVFLLKESVKISWWILLVPGCIYNGTMDILYVLLLSGSLILGFWLMAVCVVLC